MSSKLQVFNPKKNDKKDIQKMDLKDIDKTSNISSGRSDSSQIDIKD